MRRALDCGGDCRDSPTAELVQFASPSCFALSLGIEFLPGMHRLQWMKIVSYTVQFILSAIRRCIESKGQRMVFSWKGACEYVSSFSGIAAICMWIARECISHAIHIQMPRAIFLGIAFLEIDFLNLDERI